MGEPLEDQSLVAKTHFLTSFSAIATDIGANSHQFIVQKAFAIRCAGQTDFGTSLTSSYVKVGFADHKIGRDPANLAAVLKKADVAKLGVVSTFHQTVLDHLFADLRALDTVLNAHLHVFGHRLEEILNKLL